MPIFLHQGDIVSIDQQFVEGHEEYDVRLKSTLSGNPLATQEARGMIYGPVAIPMGGEDAVQEAIKDADIRPIIVAFVQRYADASEVMVIKKSIASLPLKKRTDPIPFDYIGIIKVLTYIPHTPLQRHLHIGGHHFNPSIPGVDSMTSMSGEYQLITSDRVLREAELDRVMPSLAPGGLFMYRSYDLMPSTDMRIIAAMMATESILDPPIEGDISFDTNIMPLRQAQMRIESYGLTHVCTKHMDDTLMYVCMYRSSGVDDDMILEYRQDITKLVDTSFPRKADGSMPSSFLAKGRNYDDETMTYLTSWRAALEGSKLISKLVGKGGKATLYVGTGGLGGDIIPIMQNFNVSTIHAYEQVPHFYHFLSNNIEAYAGVPLYKGSLTTDKGVAIHLHQSTFTPSVVRRPRDGDGPTIVFIDPPYIREGCGYRLDGYMLAGMTLESLSQDLLRRGAKFVVMKLPKGYDLMVHHEVDASTGYYIVSRYQRKSDKSGAIDRPLREKSTTVVAGKGILVHEVLRHILMLRAKQAWDVLFLQANLTPHKDGFSRWVMNRISLGITLDPAIPATEALVPSDIITLEPFLDAKRSYGDAVTLIRTRYTSLIGMLSSTTFIDKDATYALTEAIAKEDAKSRKGDIDTLQIGMHNVSHTLLRIYMKYKDTKGMNATLNVIDGSVSVSPNDILLGIIKIISNEHVCDECISYTSASPVIQLPISKGKVWSLRARHGGSIGMFHKDLACILLRYGPLVNTGVNLHAAVPPRMYKEMPTDLECFASPLNATMDRFLSLYPDIDAPFGSQGTFFTYSFPPGNYTANPPYTDIIMSAMYARIAALLAKDEPYSFRIVVPDWSGPPVSLIKQDPRKRLEVFLSSGQHKYVLGSQHVEVQKVIFAIDTYIAFLQNDAGAAKWPLASDTVQKVKEIFSS